MMMRVGTGFVDGWHVSRTHAPYGPTRLCDLSERLQPALKKGSLRCAFSEVPSLESENVAEKEQESFVKFGGVMVPQSVDRSLKSSGIVAPSAVQDAALSRIVDGESVILHAETGSGKTIAYLLPIVLRMLDPEQDEKRSYLIVVPSRELALQVVYEASKLLGEQRHRVELLTEPKMPAHGVLVVGTGKNVQLLSEKYTFTGFANIFQTVVLDEVDRLLGTVGKHAARNVKMRRKRHPKPVALFLQRMAEEGRKSQLVVASATVSRALRREIATLLQLPVKEGLTVIHPPKASSDLGAAMISAQEADEEGGNPIGIPGVISHVCIPLVEDNFEGIMDGLCEALISMKPSRAIVFVHKSEPITDVINSLHDRGWTEAVALHEAFGFSTGALDEDGLVKYGKLAQSPESQVEVEQEKAEVSGKVGEASSELLVAAEGSARGVHVSDVDYVFLLNCPDDQNEYQHLAGRTGRMGKPGTVVSVCSYRKARVMKVWQTQLKIQIKRIQLDGLS